MRQNYKPPTYLCQNLKCVSEIKVNFVQFSFMVFFIKYTNYFYATIGKAEAKFLKLNSMQTDKNTDGIQI